MAPTLAAANAPLRAAAIYTPNDALQRDAGSLAASVARVLPRPHAAYFESDAGRRRLIAYLCALDLVKTGDADALATWSMRRLQATFAPNTPDGFLEALKRGEGVWTRDDLHMLIGVLQHGGEGAKTLRHLSAINRMTLATLAELPDALRRVKIVRMMIAPYYAELLARTVKQAWGRTPEAARLRTLVQRLERAPSQQAAFGWLVEEVGVARITPPAIPGTDWLRPILDVRDIERTALKFQNCLRTRVPMMLRGQAAYFEVLGDEPAVVEVLVNRKFKWAVGEIRGHANDDVSAALLVKITTYLRAQCVSDVGRPSRLALELAEAAGW